MKNNYIPGMVSIVIPTHNRHELLPRAVNSAIRQTYANTEIIVVSDGSEDQTDEVMEKICAANEKVKYIAYKPGKGGNHARNTGIKNAVGEWVAFLDDDDEWHDDKIQRQIDLANQDTRIGLVCTAINIVNDTTGAHSQYVPDAPLDASVEILKNNCVGSTTTAMARHQLLDECGMFDENIPAKQDFDLWVRLCQVTYVGVVKTPCVEYHDMKSNNQISWNYKKFDEASRYMFQKYKKLREEKLSPADIKRIQVSDCLSIARKAMKGNLPAVVRQYSKKALRIRFNGTAIVYYISSFFSLGVVERVRKYIKF